jgi:hypothetical protein
MTSSMLHQLSLSISFSLITQRRKFTGILESCAGYKTVTVILRTPSDAELKVRPPLTEGDKLVDLPSHPSRAIKLQTVFSA